MAKRAFNQPKEQAEEPRQQTCTAAGCELMGTRSLSLSGSNRWYCRFHYGQPLANFQIVTERVQKAQPLINHIKRLKSANAEQIQTRAPVLFNYLRNDRFSAETGESYGQYVRRLEVFLNNYVKDGLENRELEETKNLVSSMVSETAKEAEATPKAHPRAVQAQAGAILDAEAKRQREQARNQRGAF